MRILFVTARSFPLQGGVETHVYEVGRRLAAIGNDVTVLSTDTTGTLAAEEVSLGVRTVRVRAWPRHGGLYYAPGIQTFMSRGSWDVVHVQGYHTLVAPMAMLTATWSKTPFVVTFHSGGNSNKLRHGVRGIQQRFLGPLLARADLLIGVSEFEAEMFRDRLKLPADRFVVVPNGAELPVADEPSPPTDPNVILSVGRLERYKGHQRAIAAMPNVLVGRPTARLRIVGSGPFENELRSLANQLGIADRVGFASIGGSDRTAMAREFAQAALVVLFSDYEAHPIAVMEALYLRRPVLVTRTSGLAELADKGLVRSIPLSASASEIAASILRNLDDPLVPNFTALPTWDDCIRSLSALYESILHKDRQRSLAG